MGGIGSTVEIGIVPPLELVTCSHVFSPQLPPNQTCKLSSPNRLCALDASAPPKQMLQSVGFRKSLRQWDGPTYLTAKTRRTKLLAPNCHQLPRCVRRPVSRRESTCLITSTVAQYSHSDAALSQDAQQQRTTKKQLANNVLPFLVQ
jgi:hypothetical protein